MKPFIKFAGYQKVVKALNAFQSEMDRYVALQIRVDSYTTLFSERGVDAAETFLCNGLEVFKRNFTTAHELIRVNEYNIIALISVCEWQTEEYIERTVSASIEAFNYEGVTSCFAFELIETNVRVNRKPESILANLQAKLRPEWVKDQGTVDDNLVDFSDLDFSVAFERGEIKTFFQPIIDKNCLIRGVEALCRWEHDKYGLIGPDQFLDSLFKHHFSFELFSLNVREIIAFRALVFKEHGLELVCSLNVDEELLNDPRFELSLSDLPEWCYQGGLELEIVESSKGVQSEKVERMLERVKHRGLTLAVDDFGVGFGMENSYSEIFDTLKLDRSFVKKITQGNDVSLHIMKAIETAYHSRSGNIVAEGIEDISQFNALKELNVDYFQGFGIAIPCTPNDCLNFIGEVSELGFKFDSDIKKGNSSLNVVELFSSGEVVGNQ